jgi:CheY-like chemotaxis protein
MSGSILVAEDDQAIREALQGILETEGYAVEVARNGREALERLHTGPLPALLIVDLVMPVLNGWDLCAALGREPALAALPVLVVSARKDGDGPFPLPGAHFLPKPIPFDHLLAEVERHCR